MFENNGYQHNENEQQNFDLNRMNYYQPYSAPSGGQRPPERKRRHRKGAGTALLLAGCMVVSGAAGFGGGYAALKLMGGDNSSTVVYRSVVTEGESASSSGEELSVSQVVEKVSPSVVEITAEVVSDSGFFSSRTISASAGSGVIISEDGTIVTNNHVIDGANQVTVRLYDGTEYEAEIVGADSKTDLAVLKIDAEGLTAAVIGSSDSLQVGDTAIAVGNPLGELGGTVTNGIISALNREVTVEGETMNLLQTNAAINPGNSGGGLFNSKGELIGIVNAKSSGSDVEGLGFAIPIDTAMPVVEQLISQGYVSGRSKAGVTLVDIQDFSTAMRYGVQYLGVYVYSVEEGSGAEKAGLQKGDCILEADGEQISQVSDFKAVLENHDPGDTISLTVLRDGRAKTLELTLDESVPEEPEVQNTAAQ